MGQVESEKRAPSKDGQSVISHEARRCSGGGLGANPKADGSYSDALIGDEPMQVILGVMALATYWAWIFAIFHASILSPFPNAEIHHYLLLCAVTAGGSAVSMIAFVLLGRTLHRLIDTLGFSLILAILSVSMGIPALLSQMGIGLDMMQIVMFWVVGALSSSFIYLKTGPFFVWIERGKLMRCISLAFLFASLLYLLAIFLNSFAGICMTMAMPAISVLCSHAVNRKVNLERIEDCGQSSKAHLEMVVERTREFARAVPRTVLYTLVFGVTSYSVLSLAVEGNLVVVIGVSILVSSVVFAIYAFSRNAEIDSERYRTLLLPLIAIAVLPFPYVPDLYRVFFLALVVFGFTCFDAITWGDLADEIRDRNLPVYLSLAIPTVGNFAGIFLGWAAGSSLYAVMGDGFDRGFAVFSIVSVIALVCMLVWDLGKFEKEAAASHSDTFLEKWKTACGEIAASGELTNQEKNVYLMLARGRNQHYIADELFISPHTVKTHTYHIYKKIGVHSQQELIDMVEARL